MSFSQVTAIVRPGRVEDIETSLRALGVPGITVSQVKGYGDYADFYSNDWMVSHVRLEVYIATDKAEKTAEIIMAAAHTGLEGDGLVAITPVSHIYHIRTQCRCEEDPG